MTERKSSRKEPRPLIEQSYVDPAGIPRVTLLPTGEAEPSMGIPVSLDLAPLFGHMPESFQAELTTALHAVGLVKAADYFKPGASDLFRAAMLTVIKHDFLNVQALAKQEMTHA